MNHKTFSFGRSLWFSALCAIAIGCGSSATPAGPKDGGSGGGTAGSGGGSPAGSGGSGSGGSGSGGSGSGGSAVGSGGTSGSGGVVGTGGSGGSGTGGAVGTGGAGGMLPGAVKDTTCGMGVTPTGIGRCSVVGPMGRVVGKGTALTIHNFEEPGTANDYLGVFFADGRAGTWFKASYMNSGTMAVEQTPGTAGQMTRAMHFSGAAPQGYGATIGVPMANCYDASAYRGVSFWIKGDPSGGKNPQLKFSVHTPISEPVGAGATPIGGCSVADETAGKCRDHYAKVIPITATWTRHNIKWADLKQNCPSNVPANYNPASQILTVSWTVPNAMAAYDFWIDNFTFDTGDLPTGSFGEILSEATFNELWMTTSPLNPAMTVDLRNPFYRYADMLAAAGGYQGFATTGDPTIRRMEVAAFMSNTAHETDSLALVEENCMRVGVNCAGYGMCGASTCHGRGPIQLTGPGNYTAAGTALGLDLLNNPNMVSTVGSVAWRTAFWFWMTQAGAGSMAPHFGIAAGQFGATVNSVNGALECGGRNPATIANRVKHYRRFCAFLGIDPGPDNVILQGC